MLVRRICVLLMLAAPAALAETEKPLPSLQKKLDDMAAGFADRAPVEMQKKFAQGILDVKSLGLAETALKVGDPAPQAKLLSTKGEPVDFSSVWSDGPAVVIFYRGGWCPYCNVQLKAWADAVDRVRDAGATIVAITPEMPDAAAETAKSQELNYNVLVDQGNKLAGELGITYRLPDSILPIYESRMKISERNGDDSYTLPLAATYVIDSDGVIRYAFLDADYKRRAEPSDVLEAVGKLGKPASPAPAR
ncbi:Putative peroxiredoxin bcp [Pirellulimonas nuda]|uniref:thioredoxin-dependent peroxiredoxin n=1 Tax=Pirellulimonas nuda TaxID=2528009 RepID=A0A518D5M0_9BACT|nr:peroxiredoxin-like family protein [Pirellulimonas nuda]QDU86766.1 Putative peroxiredoxin bcp [Pirellulimonas nuda]